MSAGKSAGKEAATNVTSRVSIRGLVRKAVLGVLACGVAFAAAAEPVKIRFGFADIGVGNRQFSSAGIAAIAATRGFIEDEFKDDKDVSVEFLYFKGAGPATNEALANGQIDFASHGDLPATVGRANGLKTKILAPSGARTNIYLAARPDSGITKVEDLKGKKLALFRGTNLHLATVTVLAAHGLKERDVRIVNMDFATARAALASGDVDAGIGQVDYFDLEPKGIANIVWDTRGKDPKFLRHAHVHVTEAFEQANPEITYRVAKALVRAAAWASDENNRDAVFETWAQTGYPKENFAREYEGQALNFRNSPLTDEYLVAAYKRQAELAREGGLLRKDVSIEDWFEPKYVERAVKELGYENLWTRYDADGKPIAP